MNIQSIINEIIKDAGYGDVRNAADWYKENLLKDAVVKKIKKEYVKLSDGWFDHILKMFGDRMATGDTGRFRDLEESFKRSLGINYKKSWIGDIKKVSEELDKKRKEERIIHG